jgi:hypothetical protein
MPTKRKGSRYQGALAFVPAEGGRPMFNGLRPRRIGRATGVIEHIVRDKERLDLLALHYFNDPRKWWRIVDANPDIVFSADLLVEQGLGEVILIPRVNEPGGG